MHRAARLRPRNRSVRHAMGAQPILGYNYGARAYGRMKLVLVQAIVLGIAITTPLWATVVLAPDLYAHLFGLPEMYMKETAWAFVLYLMFPRSS